MVKIVISLMYIKCACTSCWNVITYAVSSELNEKRIFRLTIFIQKDAFSDIIIKYWLEYQNVLFLSTPVFPPLERKEWNLFVRALECIMLSLERTEGTWENSLGFIESHKKIHESVPLLFWWAFNSLNQNKGHVFFLYVP